MSFYPYLFSSDGSTVGVAVDSASDEEVAKLDAILSQLGDLRTVDITATVERERVRDGEVTSTTEDKVAQTWGSTVAGVSKVENRQMFVAGMHVSISMFGMLYD